VFPATGQNQGNQGAYSAICDHSAPFCTFEIAMRSASTARMPGRDTVLVHAPGMAILSLPALVWLLAALSVCAWGEEP
jgi:hypothetical protein